MNNLGQATNYLGSWEIVPYAIIATAFFVFIMMLALISYTSSIDKKLEQLVEQLEKKDKTKPKRNNPF